MNQNLLNIAIQEAPAVFAYLRGAFAATHPGDPQPTDAEVIAAYEAAFASSVAKDDAWLAAHPD